MQVGRVVYILTEEQSDTLLSILKGSQEDALRDTLLSARKTVFIDDYRPDQMEVLSR